MTIEEELKIIDMNILRIKIIINSNYSIPLYNKLMEESSCLKKQKYNLLKKLERREKLKRINGT